MAVMGPWLVGPAGVRQHDSLAVLYCRLQPMQVALVLTGAPVAVGASKWSFQPANRE